MSDSASLRRAERETCVWPAEARKQASPGTSNARLVCGRFAVSWLLLVGTVALPVLAGEFPTPLSLQADANHESCSIEAAAPTPSLVAEAQDYVVRADDLLTVNVFDVPEISRDYRVSPAGLLILPLLSRPVVAAGLTLSELSRTLEESFRAAGLLSQPQVTITVKESRRNSVSITGAVKRPQVYSVLGRTTLLDLLSQAEGLADDASNIAVVTRGEVALRALAADSSGEHTGGQAPPRTVTIDVRRLLETAAPALNVDLYPGDRVTVPHAGVVYVVGAVNRPGGFPLRNDRQQLTVLQAVALAGDVRTTAVRHKSLIIRPSPTAAGGRQEIPIDLRKILAGQAPDQPLQAEDILFVPDSTSKRAMRRAVEAAVQAATYAVIWMH